MIPASLPMILAPREGESFVDYWLSMSPAAPFFGVDWRFAPMVRQVMPDTSVAPAAVGAAMLTEGAIAGRSVEPAPEGAPKTAPDDLTRLKGVGPKLAAELNAMGLTTFAQLAEMTEANVADLSARLSAFRDRPVRDDWVGQARALMDLPD